MTRYPKSGKGRKWTVAELKAVPAASRGDMLADGDGLLGEVRVAGDGGVSLHWTGSSGRTVRSSKACATTSAGPAASRARR
jgi:hypothetical protein